MDCYCRIEKGPNIVLDNDDDDNDGARGNRHPNLTLMPYSSIVHGGQCRKVGGNAAIATLQRYPHGAAQRTQGFLMQRL
jgi:hypothetical protein